MIQETKDTIKKQYYTIGEVARDLDLSTSLIRFWETEFEQLNPKKNRKGNRIYTEKDINTLQQLKYLLKTRKYTIKGAKEFLSSGSGKVDEEIQLRETLRNLKSFLIELKETL